MAGLVDTCACKDARMQQWCRHAQSCEQPPCRCVQYRKDTSCTVGHADTGQYIAAATCAYHNTFGEPCRCRGSLIKAPVSYGTSSTGIINGPVQGYTSRKISCVVRSSLLGDNGTPSSGIQ